jgi:hypothetical protein
MTDTLMLIEGPVGIHHVGETRMWPALVWDDEPAAY